MGLLFLWMMGVEIKAGGAENFLKISMAGFGISISVAGFISLFGPTDSLVNLGFSVLSFAVIIRFIALRQMNFSLKLPHRASWKSLIFSMPLLIILAFSIFMASMLPQIKDTWFYHLQAIKWIEEYGAVKGLGNFFSNAAYNSGVFIGNAVFSLKPLIGQNYFAVNAFLWISTLLYAILRSIRNSEENDFKSIFIESFVILMVYRYFHLWISSSSPDPASASILIFCYFMVRDMMKNEVQLNDKIVLSTLFILLITIKLSNCIFIIPAAFLLYSCKESFTAKKIYLAVLPLFILTPWLIRNVILTGYLFYPFHSPDLFNFDWKIPQIQVIYEEMLIRSWALKAILPDAPVSFFPVLNWFPAWFEMIGLQIRILLIATIISMLTLVIFFFRRHRKMNRSYLIFWISCIITLIFWFLTAPSPRFVLGLLIITLMLPLESFSFNNRLLAFKALSAILVFALLIFSLQPQFSGEMQHYPSKFGFIKPPSFPNANVRNATINSISFNYADPAVSLESYDATLPCTPQIRKGLTMRGTEISSGFRINPDLAGSEEENFKSIKKYYQSQSTLNQ